MINTLIARLQDLATFRNRADKGVQVQVEIPEIPVLALSPRDAFIRKQKSFHLKMQRVVL